MIIGKSSSRLSYAMRFNAAVSHALPAAGAILRKRKPLKDARMSRAQKRFVVSLWKSNRKMAATLQEKDQIIAWLSGCYSVNEYQSE